MADDIIHANTTIRGSSAPKLVGCGAPRSRGIKVTGNLDIVTCKDCLALYKPKTKKTKKEE